MEKCSGLSAKEVLGRYPLDLFPSLQDEGAFEYLNFYSTCIIELYIHKEIQNGK